MAKKKRTKILGKFTKTIAIIASVLVILPCLAIVVFGVMDITETIPLLGEPRTYTVSFFSEGINISSASYKRGEKLTNVPTPINNGATFMGWDIDGNNIPDILPTRVYMNIKARAMWLEDEETSNA